MTRKLSMMAVGQRFMRKGEVWEVLVVNQSRARIRSCRKILDFQVKTHKGEEVTFSKHSVLDVSPDAEYDLVEVTP